MKKSRRWLMVMVAAGLIGLGASNGTFATFNAQTTNPNNQFVTGTLLMSNQVKSQTVCLSYNGTANANSGCDAIIDLSGGGEPGSLLEGTLTLGNTGTIDPSSLTAQIANCTATAGTHSFGAANLCSNLDIFIEEVANGTVDSSGNFTPVTSGLSDCLYGSCPTPQYLSSDLAVGTSGSSLTLTATASASGNDPIVLANTSSGAAAVLTANATTTSGHTLGTNSYTLPYAFPAAQSIVYDAASLTGTALSTLQTTAYSFPKESGQSSPLPSLQARQFLIGLMLPYSDGNAEQDQTVKFDLNWTMAQ